MAGCLDLEVVAAAHALAAHVVEGHELVGGHVILGSDGRGGLAACHLVGDGADVAVGVAPRDVLLGCGDLAPGLNDLAVGVQVVAVVVDAVLAHDEAVDLL